MPTLATLISPARPRRVALAVLLTAAACRDGPVTVSRVEVDLHLRGRVTAVETGAPIPEAMVSLVNPFHWERGALVSTTLRLTAADADGRYTIRYTADCSHVLPALIMEASAAGRMPQRVWLTGPRAIICTSEPQDVNFALEPEPEPEPAPEPEP